MSDPAADRLKRILVRAFEEFREANEDADPANWRLGPDDYYDFLAGWGIGHRQLREWLHEPRAGATVTLTRKGIAVFKRFAAETPDE